MKNLILICLLLFGTAAAAATYRAEQIPNVQRIDRSRYVSNPDGILPDGAVMRIDSLCASLRERGLAQVAVVAVEEIEGDDVFEFAIELFRSWGVGSARTDNGLGVLFVRDRHEIRFVTGGGLEGVLPDALCKRIQLEYMLPAFREEEYGAGMVAGMEAAALVLEGGEPDFSESGEELPDWMIFLIVFGFLVIPLGSALVVLYARRRCPVCRRATLRQQSQQELHSTHHFREVEYTYVCTHCGHVVRRKVRHMRDDDFSGGSGGGTLLGGGTFFGGGGSGGGFGGGGSFGGGSFGGGGAGSKW